MRARAGLRIALCLSAAALAGPSLTSAQSDRIVWLQVTDGQAFDQSPYFSGLAQGTDGTLVMVGIVRDHKGRPTAAAWRSTDGLSWTRSVWDAPKVSGAAGVVATTDGFVAIGGGRTWTSPDGVTWTARVVDGAAFYDIAATGDGLVAVGQADRGVSAEPTLWTSHEAPEWGPKALGPAGRPVRVATAPDGTIVVAGDALVTDGPPTPIVWVVRSGVVTTATLPGLAAVPSGVMDLRWTPAGFVMGVSQNDDGRQAASVWISSDGVSWARSLDLLDGTITALGTLDDQVLAFGSDRMWQTTDGLDWQEIPVPAFAGHGIAADIQLEDGRILAAGARYTGPDTSEPATFLGQAGGSSSAAGVPVGRASPDVTAR